MSKIDKHPWTMEDADRAAKLWQQLGAISYSEKFRCIARVMGRTYGSISGRHTQFGERFRRDGDGNLRYREAIDRPSPAMLADRDRRASLQRPTLTAEFFGDPLPGYSALDRRLGDA